MNRSTVQTLTWATLLAAVASALLLAAAGDDAWPWRLELPGLGANPPAAAPAPARSAEQGAPAGSARP